MTFSNHVAPAMFLLGALAISAHAQPAPFRQLDPRVSNQPGVATGAPVAQGAFQAGYVTGANQGAAAANAANFYGGSSGGSGGFLSGAADVINANGNYQIQQQDARLKFEDWQQSKLQTRQRTIQEWQWEQQQRPTWLDQKAQLQTANLQIARNDPPLADVWSGKTLNVLLKAFQQGLNSGLAGPPVTVDQAMLAHIRLTDGQTSTGVGLLKDGGKLTWPVALGGPDFATDRKRIDGFMLQAAQQAGGKDGVDPATIGSLEKAVNTLETNLREQIRADEITPTRSVQGKRYVTELRDTIRLLQDPNVTAYLTGQRTPQGRTVPEVVQYVLKQGLSFAPATRGDEQAYTALYNAFLAYDGGMQALAASRGQPPSP
jgi:hypothetical protein